MKRPRFIMDWPADLSDRVEAYRRGRGLKATAEAVRELLNAALAPPVQDTAGSQKPAHKSLTKAAEADPKPKRAQTADSPTEAASEPQKRLSVDVPYAEDVKRGPMPKGATKPKGGKR